MGGQAVAADDERSAEVENLYASLDAVTAEIVTQRQTLEQLYERRRVVFAQLLERDEKQAVVARRARVSPMAVAFAVGKQSTTRKTGRAK